MFARLLCLVLLLVPSLSASSQPQKKNIGNSKPQGSIIRAVASKTAPLALPVFATTAVASLGPQSSRFSLPIYSRDLAATAATAALAAGFIKVATALRDCGRLSGKDSRKLIHTLSAPMFICTWPMYSQMPWARWLAGCVPAANIWRLREASRGGEAGLARAVSRSGDEEEAGGGPMAYAVVLGAATIGCWTRTTAGVVGATMMAAGDGMADVVGRRVGGLKWGQWTQKSPAGSAAFVASGVAASAAVLGYLGASGVMTGPITNMTSAEVVRRLSAVSLVAAAVELVPVGDDNWTVPAAAGLCSWALLG